MKPERALATLAACAMLIFWIGAWTDIDLRLANAMYDRASGSFPWRHAWLAEVASHVYLKAMLVCLALGVIVPALWDWWRPIAAWRRGFRLRMRIVAWSAVLVPLVISLLKHASVSHCPWDLAMYGGGESYVRLLESALPHALAGHCLPAGHASSALWLPAFAMFWLPRHPRRAALVALLLAGFGFAVGWLQQLRGAHFLTHTLWSMWWAAAIIWAVSAWMMRPRRARRVHLFIWSASHARRSAKGRADSSSLNIS